MDFEEVFSMSLYDNDSYREEFMEEVYKLLADDPDNSRANEIIDLFDGAPSIPSSGVWVSVGEKLPETGIPVLIYNRFWDYPVVANYAGKGVWMNTWYQKTTCTPTHWTPIPILPEEGGEI